MNARLTFPSSSMPKQAGFTLIELLISMAMGIALIAVVFLSYQNISGSNRLSAAQQQMNEDAQAAFQVLGQQMRSAGYNPLQPRTTVPVRNMLSPAALAANEVGMGIFGCKNGFSNGSGASPAANMSALTCASTGDNVGLAVQYEADAFSPTVSGSSPADCRKAAVPTLSQSLTTAAGAPAPAATYSLIENRFFILNGGLSCTGNGGTPFSNPSQPLVGNIEKMEVQFGLVNPIAAAGTTPAAINAAQFVSGYLDADKIGDATGLPGAGVDAGFPATLTGSRRWDLVRTVRVCLVVKSASPMLVDSLGTSGSNTIFGYYAGCNPTDSTQINITDRFLRKAYVMHFALRNRITLP